MRLRLLSFLSVAALAAAVNVVAQPPADPPAAPPGVPAAGTSTQPVALLLRQDAPPAPAKFARGAKRSPGHRVASAPRFLLSAAPPPQFAMIPSAIHMWGNDQFGDCVSAQTCCSMAAWTTHCGNPVVPTDAECIAFARKYGLLNGADLTQVMDIMASKGMTVGGKLYKEGGYSSVDYSVPLSFQSALCVGPVNVAIDADALPSGAGNKQGWYAFGGRAGQFPNTDHCITFLAYGPASFCYQSIGVALPAGVDATKACYVCDTWNTLGVVDQDWVMSTMEEAWVRNPTTVGFTPPAPNPPPTPNPPVPPTPNPPVPPTPPAPGTGFTGTLTYANGALMSATAGPAPAPVGVEADLKAAGVNPAVIGDVLQLIADVKNKAGMATIAADLVRLIADLSTPAAKQVKAVPRSYPAVVPGPELAKGLVLKP